MGIPFGIQTVFAELLLPQFTGCPRKKSRKIMDSLDRWDHSGPFWTIKDRLDNTWNFRHGLVCSWKSLLEYRWLMFTIRQNAWLIQGGRMGKGGDPKCKGRSSTLLYPSVYKMIRLGTLPCSYWANFGHFLPNTLPKRRKNLTNLIFDRAFMCPTNCYGQKKL